MFSLTPFTSALDEDLDNFFITPGFQNKPLATYTNKKNMLKTDIIEKDAGYDVTVEVPGVPKSAIDISTSVKNHSVTIKVTEERTKSNEKEPDEEKKNYIYRERYQGSFARSFTLPQDCEINAAKAKVEHGILHLEFPKKKTGDEMKKITVN